MNNTVDKGLLEISQELTRIQSENEIINLLSNAIKYLTDRLIDSESKISKEDELKINTLLEKLEGLKTMFLKYQEFFDKNKSQIQEFIKIKSDITLLQDKIFFRSKVVELTDFFPKFLKSLIEIIAYTDSFFKINNFSSNDKNSFSSLLEIVGKGKTKDEKVITLKNELSSIESFIKKIDAKFISFDTLIGDFERVLDAIKNEISFMFLEKSQDGFFSRSSQTNNVSFVFENNFILTSLLENIFLKIPKNESGIKSFLDDLILIGTSNNLKMVNEKTLISDTDYKNLISLFDFYSKLCSLHFNAQKEILQIKKQINNINSPQAILTPEDDEKKEKLGVFGKNKPVFLHDLKDMKEASLLDDIKIEKKEIGNPELLKLKKEIFLSLSKIIKEISQLSQEEINELQKYLSHHHSKTDIEGLEKSLKKKKIKDSTKIENILGYLFSLTELKTKYYELQKKENESFSSDDFTGKKSTFHYKPVLDGYGVISGFEEVKTDEIVAKTIGKTADEIRNMVDNILSRDKFLNILQSFPGNAGSLEGNYIILGPWGGGKTALIKELSQDSRIATVEVDKSDIVDMYVGATEKNIKAIYEHAYKIHLQTKKHVFIFIDEVDAVLGKITTTGGGSIDVQKEIQTMLDGVHAYPGVHTVMLSNVPHKIPIDIYRRMEKTFILNELDMKEKVDLINSRIGRYPFSQDLKDFILFLNNILAPNVDFVLNSGFERKILDEMMETGDFEMIQKISLKQKNTLIDLYIEKELGIVDKKKKDAIKRLYLITPKILWQVTEKIFKNFLLKFNQKDLTKLDKSLSRLKVHSTPKVLKIFSGFPLEITLDDFLDALDQVFSNASVKSEIKGNLRFYENANDMMNKISSSAFDGVGQKDSSNANNMSLTIVMGE